MPRTRSLTWQPGSHGRPGRWRKKLRGRTYYFAGGRGKTDQAAYKAAQDKWVQIRAKVQAETPKRHQLEYEREIATWNRVLTWSRQNDEQPMAEIATNAIARLRAKLAVPIPPPLAATDSFDGYFEPAVRSPGLVRADTKPLQLRLTRCKPSSDCIPDEMRGLHPCRNWTSPASSRRYPRHPVSGTH